VGPCHARDLVACGGRLDAATRIEPKVRHGRREARMLWALHDPDWNAHLGWPHLAQVCRVERRRETLRGGQVVKVEVEVSYAITSLGPAQAGAARLLRLLRGHWGIENRAHWVRDVTFDEDRCPIRSGAAPQAFAACRNLAIALLRQHGHDNIAEALRTHAGRPRSAVALVTAVGRH
jgi:hypothetical protein